MTLISLYFLIFLVVVAALYYILPRSWQWILLLTASLVFCLLTSYAMIIVLLAEALVVFLSGRVFEDKKNKAMMLLVITLIIAMIFIFKYGTRYFPGLAGSILFSDPVRAGEIVVPLGISYYSLMAIGYCVDVFRGKYPAEKNYARLLLFLAFFPVMTQGPICRYEEMSEQLTKGHSFSYENLTFGIQRMAWGFFKKLVISERMRVMSDHLSAGWGDSAYSGIYVPVALLFFSFRLYTDFSGCMDIVTGAAQIFGITLPENFDHPYISRSVPEFWRRWHITLGAWLKDYVMFSVTMSGPAKTFIRKTKDTIGRKNAALIVNCTGLLFVWFVFAVWHDISTVFLVSGAFYAVLVILSTVIEPLVKKFRKRFPVLTGSMPYQLFMMIRTIFLGAVSAYFVFTPTLKDALSYLGSIFTKPAAAFIIPAGKAADMSIAGLDLYDAIVLAAAFIIWLIVSRVHTRKDPRGQLAKMNTALRWVILLALIMAIVIFGKYGGYNSSSFVYQSY